MTQQELADAADVDTKTIGNLERRGKWPIARTRARIEKALGWPPGEMERIASEESEQPPPSLVPEGLRQDIMNEKDLTPEERQAVIDAVEATLARERGEPGSSAAVSFPPSGRRRQASLPEEPFPS